MWYRTSSSQVASCAGGRQLALEQQVGGLEEAGGLGELVDRVAAVAEDARVAVDVGDRAPAGGGVQEGRVVRDDRRKLGRADRAVDDRQGDLLAGAVVDDGERLFRHAVSLAPAW